MKLVALTGNKCSGKNTVSKSFEKLGVPVFDGDLVSRYMLNHRSEVISKVVEKFGRESYKLGSIDPRKFQDADKFNKLMDIIEFDVIKSFQYWASGKINNHYCIFKYSILFERKINTSFDLVINTYSPLGIRAERMFDKHRHQELSKIMTKLSDEMDELTKNGESDLVIHNYANFGIDKQVRQANAEIIANKVESMKRLVF